MDRLTIIMYHYVRDLSLSRYPNIKGLDIRDFKKQIDFLRDSFTMVTIEDCMEAIYSDSDNFPENAALLTFDDGYQEHFTEVFPVLHQHGIQGVFFPPAQPVLNHKVLDVNKIHFILAAVNQPKKLVEKVNTKLIELANDFQIEEPRHYIQKLSHAEHRYDPPEIVYVKRLLQRELPDKPRKIILDELFEEFVGIDEKVFAKELYMNREQIRCMKRNGMFIGGHGYSHAWLDELEPEELTNEIDKTVEFLEDVEVQTNGWVMCYPYGAYNSQIIGVLKEKNCRLALTTDVGRATLTKDNAFTLNRFDANDLQDLIEGKSNAISDNELV